MPHAEHSGPRVGCNKPDADRHVQAAGYVTMPTTLPRPFLSGDITVRPVSVFHLDTV